MNRQQAPRRQQKLRLNGKGSSPHGGADDEPLIGEDRVNLTAPIHSKAGFSVMSLMHALYKHSGTAGGDIQAEGFKGAVLMWSGAYYVAYALMMTIAFALLVVIPEPRNLIEHSGGARLMHYRPDNETFDAFMQLVYVFFAACACCA